MIRYPHLHVTRAGRECGLCFWPVRGLMLAIYWGGGPYNVNARDKRVRALAFGRVILLSVDLRP